MKKVLLLGDSIRQGYQGYVKDKLDGIAEIYFPSENCKFTTNMVRYIYEWAAELKLDCDEIDIVHWNAGLWDCLRMEDGEPLVPIDFYEKNIARIQSLINKAFPNAKSIFATSTTVSEAMWKLQGKHRSNSEIAQYNEVAKHALSSYGVTINDLYALVAPLPDSYHSDATHFCTPEARMLIGDQVVNHILDALEIEGIELSETKDDYPQDKIIGI